MIQLRHILGGATALLAAGLVMAAGADLGQAVKQEVNTTAIVMFAIFIGATLWITKWAASKTKTAADFYTAGGGITGFQNGLAIAGDYMSAASFLGISRKAIESYEQGWRNVPDAVWKELLTLVAVQLWAGQMSGGCFYADPNALVGGYTPPAPVRLPAP
jgi:hypothetical protein